MLEKFKTFLGVLITADVKKKKRLKHNQVGTPKYIASNMVYTS